jgi:hypothetical protein
MGPNVNGAHLFVPMLHRNDAVGKHTLAVRDALVAAGVPSQIFTDRPDSQTVGETRPYLDYEKLSDPEDVLIYQLATDSEMAVWLSGRSERLVLNHHSITPSPVSRRAPFSDWRCWRHGRCSGSPTPSSTRRSFAQPVAETPLSYR